MNRAQRREYAKHIKNSKIASICPLCGTKARFYTHQRGKDDVILCCEVCNGIVHEGEAVSKLLVPGIFLPIPLEVFDKVLEKDNQLSSAES